MKKRIFISKKDYLFLLLISHVNLLLLLILLLLFCLHSHLNFRVMLLSFAPKDWDQDLRCHSPLLLRI